MRITEKGQYRLLEDIKTTTAASIGTIPKGTILDITQVDERCHRVIGRPLMDWTYWDLPVESINTISAEV